MYHAILRFWFGEIDASQWWAKDCVFDQLITERFSAVHTSATRCELFEWRKNAKGRLAEVIILDQFTRNMLRGSPLSFAYDSMALALSQEAISASATKVLNPLERSFLYMPFMHSESLEIHKIALNLFQKNGIQSNLDSAIRHKEIIERFGRYPHRNSILGRVSTTEEIEFLNQPGSVF